MKRVLYIEDSPEERLLVEAGLTGYIVSFAKTARDAIALLERESFSLIIADIILPDGSGLEILGAARSMQKFANVPIMILSGRRELSQKAEAFALGADDFIQKPCDMRELKIRVDARIRRIEQSGISADLISIGDLVLDRPAQLLRRSGGAGTIELTTLELKILTALAKPPGRVLSREALMDLAWGSHVTITQRTVDSHIANLRRKIRGAASYVNVETVIGAGYKLTIRPEKAS